MTFLHLDCTLADSLQLAFVLDATVIDLAEAAEAAACPIARRPHMMSAFDVFYSMKYVVISNVGSGDIQVSRLKVMPRYEKMVGSVELFRCWTQRLRRLLRV